MEISIRHEGHEEQKFGVLKPTFVSFVVETS